MLCLHNGGLHETLNLLHVGSCKMLHFLTCYMNQTKNHKQTLKSVQYRPEIILNEIPLQTHGNMKPQTFTKTKVYQGARAYISFLKN